MVGYLRDEDLGNFSSCILKFRRALGCGGNMVLRLFSLIYLLFCWFLADVFTRIALLTDSEGQVTYLPTSARIFEIFYPRLVSRSNRTLFPLQEDCQGRNITVLHLTYVTLLTLLRRTFTVLMARIGIFAGMHLPALCFAFRLFLSDIIQPGKD